MRLRGIAVAALLAAGACAAQSAATAQAQIAWAPCGNSNEYACGHLTVPLDPVGSAPGSITLAMRRHRASVGEAHEAIIALAGGPGQAALPFAEDFAHLLGPIAATRDLIVFDQRGIGLSHPLSCHRFELNTGGPGGQQISECAAQLGPERSDYTTADTVADIEAIRQAGGYEKLVLYGTSYGTKVAERYAQTYPSHVSALVLDSVVPPNGPEPLDLPTFQAIPRVLRQLCAAHACAHITPEPVADLRKLVRRMHGGSLSGRWIDGEGHAHTLRFDANTLLDVLIAGDLEPVLRAEFPAAVRAAAGGDTAPFARLLRAYARRGEGGEAESPSESFDTPLYYATSCEEELFPWNRASSPAKRLAEATTRIRALPASAIAPFEPANVLAISDMPACAFWPYSTPAPAPVQEPFPSVPTLILSGADDLRTPTANAREVAAQIPGSHLLVVPEVGHSVLGSDLSGCASKALQALFKPAPIEPCTGGPQILSLLHLAPLAPARLSAVAPAAGSRGLPGRTLAAVELTLADFLRQETIQALGALESGNIGGLSSLRVGGLRAGWAQTQRSALILHGYSYIPGVTVSGTVTASATVLRIGGSAAAHGTLRLVGKGRLAGSLGGRDVQSVSGSQPASADASDAIVGANAQAALKLAPGGSAARTDARDLAGLLERVP
jgi:pimeloyl-ACP methyl ester carboxylesterase